MRNKLKFAASALSLCAAAVFAGCTASRAAEPLEIDSNPLLVQAFTSRADIAAKMSPDGAIGANQQFEQGSNKNWYIEEQKDAFIGAWGAAIDQSPQLAKEAETAYDWGFNHESRDGSFPMPKSVPLGRKIHSTAMFVEAAAHSMLDLKESGIDPRYAATRGPALVRAAIWLAQSIPGSPNANSELVDAATGYDQGHGHRPYEKGAALQEASLLADGRDRALLQQAADSSIQLGLSTSNPVGQRQRGTFSAEGEQVSLRGVNPENDNVNDYSRPLGVSYDSSYEALGLYYAALYAATTQNYLLRSEVLSMLKAGLDWESGRFFPSGEADLTGNTRVSNGGNNEHSANGEGKKFAYQTALFAFCYYDSLTRSDMFQSTADSIASYKKWSR